MSHEHHFTLSITDWDSSNEFLECESPKLGQAKFLFRFPIGSWLPLTTNVSLVTPYKLRNVRFDLQLKSDKNVRAAKVFDEMIRGESHYIAFNGRQEDVVSYDGLVKIVCMVEYNECEEKSLKFTGIVNEGHSYYLHPIIQILYNIPKFRQIIFDSNGSTLLTSLKKLFSSLQTSTIPISAKPFLDSFKAENPEILQSDILEFIQTLFVFLGTPAIEELITGEIQSTFRCKQVNYKTKTMEAFTVISIQVKGFNTLEDSLDDSTREEELPGGYKTDNFGLQKATIKKKITQKPPILFLHLQRFIYDGSTQRMSKVRTHFEYPECLEWFPDQPYKLYAVIIHDGTSFIGHYYCYIDITMKSEYYRFDDSIIRPAIRQSVFDNNFGGDFFTTNPVFLVYIRKDSIDMLFNTQHPERIPINEIIEVYKKQMKLNIYTEKTLEERALKGLLYIEGPPLLDILIDEDATEADLYQKIEESFDKSMIYCIGKRVEAISNIPRKLSLKSHDILVLQETSLTFPVYLYQPDLRMPLRYHGMHKFDLTLTCDALGREYTHYSFQVYQILEKEVFEEMKPREFLKKTEIPHAVIVNLCEGSNPTDEDDMELEENDFMNTVFTKRWPSKVKNFIRCLQTPINYTVTYIDDSKTIPLEIPKSVKTRYLRKYLIKKFDIGLDGYLIFFIGDSCVPHFKLPGMKYDKFYFTMLPNAISKEVVKKACVIRVIYREITEVYLDEQVFFKFYNNETKILELKSLFHGKNVLFYSTESVRNRVPLSITEPCKDYPNGIIAEYIDPAIPLSRLILVTPKDNINDPQFKTLPFIAKQNETVAEFISRFESYCGMDISPMQIYSSNSLQLLSRRLLSEDFYWSNADVPPRFLLYQLPPEDVFSDVEFAQNNNTTTIFVSNEAQDQCPGFDFYSN